VIESSILYRHYIKSMKNQLITKFNFVNYSEQHICALKCYATNNQKKFIKEYFIYNKSGKLLLKHLKIF